MIVCKLRPWLCCCSFLSCSMALRLDSSIISSYLLLVLSLLVAIRKCSCSTDLFFCWKFRIAIAAIYEAWISSISFACWLLNEEHLRFMTFDTEKFVFLFSSALFLRCHSSISTFLCSTRCSLSLCSCSSTSCSSSCFFFRMLV